MWFFNKFIIIIVSIYVSPFKCGFIHYFSLKISFLARVARIIILEGKVAIASIRHRCAALLPAEAGGGKPHCPHTALSTLSPDSHAFIYVLSPWIYFWAFHVDGLRCYVVFGDWLCVSRVHLCRSVCQCFISAGDVNSAAPVKHRLALPQKVNLYQRGK